MRGADDSAAGAAGPAELKRLIEAQETQIEQLQKALRDQKTQIDRILAAESRPAPAAQESGVPAPAPLAMGIVNTPDLFSRMDSSIKNLAGFRFSGDFRFRMDSQIRSGNAMR